MKQQDNCCCKFYQHLSVLSKPRVLDLCKKWQQTRSADDENGCQTKTHADNRKSHSHSNKILTAKEYFCHVTRNLYLKYTVRPYICFKGTLHSELCVKNICISTRLCKSTNYGLSIMFNERVIS